jgi:hypothetical protein
MSYSLNSGWDPHRSELLAFAAGVWLNWTTGHPTPAPTSQPRTRNLVTLVRPAGVGKTRLSLEAGRAVAPHARGRGARRSRRRGRSGCARPSPAMNLDAFAPLHDDYAY